MRIEIRKDCNENYTKSINYVKDDMYDKNDNIMMSKRRKLTAGFTKGRLKKEYEKAPLPMKLRALPESFWQQPNQPTKQAPGSICPELPLICKEENGTNTCQNTGTKSSMPPPEITTPANTELLFSLFRVVDKTNKSLIRRGRPRKPAASQVGLRDADPCLVSNEPPLVAGNKSRDNIGGSYSNLLAELVVRL